MQRIIYNPAMKNVHNLSRSLFCITAISVLLLNSFVTHAQPAEVLDGQQLEQFFDTLVPPSMEQQHVPGVVVTVTSSDSILFTKGYGYADVEKQQPVDPPQTLWRLASISKVVTGTAVMQLVEKGRADLDTDINEYLNSLEVPSKFDRPITLRHLLTHTAGFDDRYLNKSFRTRAERPALSKFIADIMPERIYPPGEIYTYSNVGNALAALVVEEITGEDFNTYCRKNIFLPLGMERTSFRLTEELEKDLYSGYVYEDNTYQEVPFDFLGDYPAGQLLSPATEFARFMMCHLQNGSYGDTRILPASIARQMHTPQFTHHPKLNGAVGYTFYVSEEKGNKTVSHNGGYVGLSTRMLLLPEQETGLFIAGNMASGIVNTLSRAFVEEYFNNKKNKTKAYPLTDLPEYDRDVEKFTGYYRGTRHTHKDFTKIYFMMGMGNDVKIWKNDKGMLMMHDHTGKPRRLIQVESGLFRSIDDDYYIAFKMDEEGQPAFLFTSGTEALEKIPAFWSNTTQLILLQAILGFFLLVLLIRAVYKALPAGRKNLRDQPVAMKKMRWSSSMAAGLFLSYWILMGLVLFVFNPAWEMTQTGLSYGMPGAMYGVQLIPLLGIIVLLAFIYRLIPNYRNPKVSAVSKIFGGLFTMVSVVYLLILNYWNLLGFHFG